MSGQLLVARDGGVVTITFSNPGRRNALTMAMYDDLERACVETHDDPTVRAVVLRGSDGAFAGGTDIGHFATFASGQDGVEYEARITEVLSAVRDLRVPLVAIVDGPCVGGGMALAALSDIVLCTPDARFGTPIAHTLGNTISAATIVRLWSTLGRRRTTELLMTGALASAEQALEAGFVTQVAEPEALEARLVEILDAILRGAPATIRSFKELGRRIDAAASSIDSDDVFDEVYGSADFREGVDAFLHRRPPRYGAS